VGVPDVGADDQVLTVVAGEPAWADAPAGGGITLLSTTTLSGSFVTVSSIPQTYKELWVEIKGATFSGSSTIALRPNSSGSGHLYAGVRKYDNNSAAFYQDNGGNFFQTDTASSGSNYIMAKISDYTSTTTQKVGQVVAYQPDYIVYGTTSVYKSTSAITSMQVVGLAIPFTGGTMKIYGVN